MVYTALTGPRAGKAQTFSSGGRSYLDVKLYGTTPAHAAAFFVFKNGDVVFSELTDGVCIVPEGASDAALIIAAYSEGGMRILCHGGFAGKRALYEKAAARVRLYARADTVPVAADTAGGSQALRDILDKAKELFEPASDVQNTPPMHYDAQPQRSFSLFPSDFPDAGFKKIGYPGTDRYYLEGEYTSGSARFTVYAVPAGYAPARMMRHQGYSKLITAADGVCYYVKVIKAK